MTAHTGAVTTTRVFGIVALAGVAVFTIACGAAQFLRTDFDWLRVPLSFYLLGPYGGMVEASYYVLAAGLVSTGIGWYLALLRDARSAAPLLLFVVAAVALCTTAIESTDIPNGTPTLHGFVHVIAAMTTFLCVTIAMLLQSWRLRLDSRWRARFHSAFTLAVITFAALWIYAPVKTIPRGFGEKSVVALILLWLWRAAWWLVRRNPGPARILARDRSS